MKKDRWEKPKLIILLKGRPEENVLAGCKTDGITVGAGGVFSGCYRTFKTTCKKCNAEKVS